MIIPRIPERPSGVGPNSFHGIQFQYFDDLGFVSGSPGVEAAPVFLYARTGPTVVSLKFLLVLSSFFLLFFSFSSSFSFTPPE